MAFLVHLGSSGPMDMEGWLETEAELMRLYDEYSAFEMFENIQPEGWRLLLP